MEHPDYLITLKEAIEFLQKKSIKSKNFKADDRIRIHYFKTLIYAISTYHLIKKELKPNDDDKPNAEVLANVKELMILGHQCREKNCSKVIK